MKKTIKENIKEQINKYCLKRHRNKKYLKDKKSRA